MVRPPSAPARRRWVRLLGEAAGERRRAALSRPGFRTPEAVGWLYEEVVRQTRVDATRADRLARAARELAERIDDPGSRALSWRAAGHVAFLKGRFEETLDCYRRARLLYRRLGAAVDEGRTLSTGLQALIYLGRYAEAFAWERRARRLFTAAGDALRLARLDLNLANIYYRQDRFEEARSLYDRALALFRERGGPGDIAVALRNRAVAEISLNDFEAALATYREARAYCHGHDMPLLVAEADYNIAYLYYLRGEYTRAIELYEAARALSEKLGDTYHAALCDLDESELSVELNLGERAALLAQRALGRFRRLGLGYELAKATLNLALAMRIQRKVPEALALFGRARRLFVRERNRVWPALTDLYHALVLFEAGQGREARRRATSALASIARCKLAAKAGLCELLIARIDLSEGRTGAALRGARRALRRLIRAESPASVCQAFFILGQIHEARGERREALAMYRRARERLESLRGRLGGEELRIAFLADKLAVFEGLVRLLLERGPPRRLEAAFGYIEEAKSRNLADLIAFRANALPAPRSGNAPLVERVRRLREELTFCQRRLGAEEGRSGLRSERELVRLRKRSRDLEKDLGEALARLRERDGESHSLQGGGTTSLPAVRAALGPDVTLLEYYCVGDRFVACVLDRENLDVVDGAPVARVRERFEMLQFQLSKFRLGAEYVRTFGAVLDAATRAHLAALNADLLGALRGPLRGRRLVIVPHGFLHYLPFHALLDGERTLVDEGPVSYAPSASVYALCGAKRAAARAESLVLGVPDALAPHVLTEARVVAKALPGARLYLGRRATEPVLRRFGPTARFVHIATHGLFRQDNPMFSSLRLGASDLNLYDLYQLRLSAELVTLSGCGTGLNVVVGGDELLGLVRGLLYAGARSVLGTLWDVNDRSTAEFMRLFYQRLRETRDRAGALRDAMLRLRETHPHPYYWAPFVLTGYAATA